MGAFLQKDNCLLLVIDLQEKLHSAMDPDLKDSCARNSVILIETAKACRIPVVVSEQYPRGLGETVPEVAGHMDGITRHEKLFFSCYREEGIRKAIKSTGRKTAVLCGIEAHVCVMQTAMDLLDAQYRVVVACDAVCSRRSGDMAASLDAMARLGVLVYPTETIAFMLMEKAGTDLFKELSVLFK